NETETSEEDISDNDPEYVPASETDSEDDEPPSRLAKSTVLAEKESSVMDISHISGITANETSANTTDSTTIAKKGLNFCFVCKKAHFKIARHFKVHVKENAEIAKALSFPAGSKSRKEWLEKLRNKGNFIHNYEVLKDGAGSLKVKRRAKGDFKKYEYCLHCKGMFLRAELWRHMRRCPSRPTDHDHQGRKRILGLASVAKSTCSSAVEEGVLKMLSRMHDDEIAALVRNDFCLLRFAESLYSKHGHDPSKHDYIRQKIRQLGRFLQTMRKRSPVLTLEDAVKPSNFLNVIEAVKETAGFDKNNNIYKTPSLALKIGHSLLKVNDIIHCHALMAEDENLVKSSDAFQKLYRAKWSEYISHSALNTISDLKYNKPTKLPLTEDIMKLNKHLDEKAKSATAALEKAATPQNYSNVARTTLTKIVLFNRRRVGEVSKMKLKNFLERDCSITQKEMNLSEYEQKLCMYFERVELKGKRGRKVAVLLTPEMTKSLNLMIMKREQCGVPNKNEYLFAIPHCLTCYRGHQCLRKFADECGAQKPDFLRSTQLRKEIATTSQMLNLKNNEMDQLADFLGHDITVHRQFYRLSEATIQSAKISKLLLALEKGKLHELRGKTLDEIGDFTDDDDDDEDESDEDTTLDTETADEINGMYFKR
ncbi:uncharacterized protein LOC127158626, partial [Labeo rohita]|uniref:uncharacterized protein LOC127158626 n=1 Tax=Labeo rohita TaxID=84645 RepID=UPI0021E20D20